MRVLLTSSASYDPPQGGSTRSNLVWVHHLRARGHEVRIVAGEHVRPPELHAAIASMQPDWVLVSSEDLAHGLLREAFRSAPGRVIYLAHTPQFFPFGPLSWNRDEPAAKLLHNAAAIVAISRTVAGYIREHAGIQARVIHPPMYGDGPWPQSHGQAVLMINLCAVKGISIFLALADRFPDRPFRALRGWGTTADDQRALLARPNITVVNTVPDIGDELSRASVLLMPSLWYEGFGLIVVEAMLRGVHVISSNAGGLVEAGLGVATAIPVHPISSFDGTFDDRHMPRPRVPEQDLEPWIHALRNIPVDRTAIQSSASNFVRGLDAGEFERMLLSLEPASKTPPVDSLSPEKRAFLLRRLRSQ